MHDGLTAAEWIDRFACELGRRVPSMSADEAYERAVALAAGDIDQGPVEAAEVYALELPPLDGAHIGQSIND